MKKFLDTFAVFVGGFLNAPSWIMYAYAYVLFFAGSLFQGSLLLQVSSFFLLIIFPMSFTIALNQLKIVEDVDSRDKGKRLIVMSVFLVAMLILILISLAIRNYEFVKFLLIISLPALVGSIINKFWLLSVHVMSSATAATVGTYLSGWPFHLVYLAVILIAWARVKEKKHTFLQVVAGGALGVLVTLLLLNAFFSPLQFQL